MENARYKIKSNALNFSNLTEIRNPIIPFEIYFIQLIENQIISSNFIKL